MEIPLEDRILFIDGEALVIDKPAGLDVSPPRRGGRSLEDDLHHLRFGFARLPQPVHRLDRDTSGCLLLSRNPKAHRRFQHAFEQGRVAKIYIAVIDGLPERDEGMIDLPLAKTSAPETGWRMVVDDAGKRAVTRWRLLDARDGRALIRFAPTTGRTHQLRAHAVYGLGAAIAGDPVYGNGEGPMLLHARALTLEREGKAPIEATAPMPRRFAEAGFEDFGLGDAD